MEETLVASINRASQLIRDIDTLLEGGESGIRARVEAAEELLAFWSALSFIQHSVGYYAACNARKDLLLLISGNLSEEDGRKCLVKHTRLLMVNIGRAQNLH